MAVTCEEKWESRDVGGESAELTYFIAGTDDHALARGALLATAGVTFTIDARILKRETQNATVHRVGSDSWIGAVPYKRVPKPEQKDPGESSYSFDTSGGTAHITQSLSTIAKFAPEGKTAPDFKGAIGVTADSIEGVDVEDPGFRWTETHYFDADDVDDAFIGNLYYATKHTNVDAFTDAKGNVFAAGEVLFLGATGSQRGNDDWEITYTFLARPNVSGRTIGTITGIEKNGHEYLWVYYGEAKDDAAKRMVKVPLAVYVEQVYYSCAYGEYLGL